MSHTALDVPYVRLLVVMEMLRRGLMSREDALAYLDEVKAKPVVRAK